MANIAYLTILNYRVSSLSRNSAVYLVPNAKSPEDANRQVSELELGYGIQGEFFCSSMPVCAPNPPLQIERIHSNIGWSIAFDEFHTDRELHNI